VHRSTASSSGFTPLRATLVLLNDPIFVEAARVYPRRGR
jgi:hypothetical protein